MTAREAYLTFLRGAAVNRWATVGVVIVTATVISFFVMQLAIFGGLVTNQYIGLITYLAFPVLFLGGLAIIPLGWYLYARRRGLGLWELVRSRFQGEELEARAAGAPLVRTIVLLTLANVLILAVATTSTLHYMDQPAFCGTACHDVMNPEWATYQASPHARVACVECHVGEGVEALIDSKINGLWQVISRTFRLYEKPIPTPVHQLRPARETCEHCHWPEIFLPDRLVARTRYQQDEANTPRYTTLLVKIGSGHGPAARGSHWHVAEANEVRYASLDDERLQMLWVEARQADGSWRRWENRTLAGRLAEEEMPEEWARTMDCIDCHNRATHIYEAPEDALDEAMAAGAISPAIPFVKRRALAALLPRYPDTTAAMAGIEAEMTTAYKRLRPQVLREHAAALEQAVGEVKAIWRRNVHPEMELYWGAYPNHLGHRQGPGCFRCHSEDLVEVDQPWQVLQEGAQAATAGDGDKGGDDVVVVARTEEGSGGAAADGAGPGADAPGQGEEGVLLSASISTDCTLCHSLLAYRSDSPEAFLTPPEESDSTADRAMHLQLHEELRRHLRTLPTGVTTRMQGE